MSWSVLRWPTRSSCAHSRRSQRWRPGSSSTRTTWPSASCSPHGTTTSSFPAIPPFPSPTPGSGRSSWESPRCEGFQLPVKLPDQMVNPGQWRSTRCDVSPMKAVDFAERPCCTWRDFSLAVRPIRPLSHLSLPRSIGHVRPGRFPKKSQSAGVSGNRRCLGEAPLGPDPDGRASRRPLPARPPRSSASRKGLRTYVRLSGRRSVCLFDEAHGLAWRRNERMSPSRGSP